MLIDPLEERSGLCMEPMVSTVEPVNNEHMRPLGSSILRDYPLSKVIVWGVNA